MNSAISVIPKILGTLFYYSPASEQVAKLQPLLLKLPEFFDWQDNELILKQCEVLSHFALPELSYDFSVLFQGQGEMVAPPWGSVYLDRENLLMGESAMNYRNFLHNNQVIADTGINEPEDQFGLMLLAFTFFLEKEQDEVAIELLEKHLLPWAPRYLQRVIELSHSEFYCALATIASEYLQQLQQQLGLNPLVLQLYK